MDRSILTKVVSAGNIYKYGGPSSRSDSRGLVSVAMLSRQKSGESSIMHSKIGKSTLDNSRDQVSVYIGKIASQKELVTGSRNHVIQSYNTQNPYSHLNINQKEKPDTQHKTSEVDIFRSTLQSTHRGASRNQPSRLQPFKTSYSTKFIPQNPSDTPKGGYSSSLNIYRGATSSHKNLRKPNEITNYKSAASLDQNKHASVNKNFNQSFVQNMNPKSLLEDAIRKHPKNGSELTIRARKNIVALNRRIK